MYPPAPCRRFQFRLRTLLLMVASAAVVFGIASAIFQWRMRITREHYVQVSISRFGGTWTGESARYYRLTGERRGWLHSHLLNHLAEIDLSQDAWPLVEKRTTGKPVPVFGDGELAILLGATQLQSLKLSGSRITDQGLPHLKRLKSLRELDLTDTKLSEAAVQELYKALPNCKVIR